MFGWEFPPHNSGGLGVACYGLCKSLCKQGIKVTFVLPKTNKFEENFLKFVFADESKAKENISFVRVKADLHPYMGYTRDKLVKTFSNNKNFLMQNLEIYKEVQRYALQAKEIALDHRYDIIHTHDWLSFLCGVNAKKVANKHLISHIHATEFDRAGGEFGNPFAHFVEHTGFMSSDSIISVSGYTKEKIVKEYGVNHKNVEVVHNGVKVKEVLSKDHLLNNTLSKFKKNGYKIVLFLGRITVQKGPDIFLEIAKKVLDHNKKVIFVMAGSGDMEAEIISKSADLGIADKMHFTGFVREKKREMLFKLADLYVMPSVSEPFGIVALESMVYKTPVILSKQSGVSEVTSHTLKADFWDVAKMTNLILSSLHYDVLRKEITKNGYKEAKKQTWDSAAKKVINVYVKTLKKPMTIAIK